MGLSIRATISAGCFPILFSHVDIKRDAGNFSPINLVTVSQRYNKDLHDFSSKLRVVKQPNQRRYLRMVLKKDQYSRNQTKCRFYIVNLWIFLKSVSLQTKHFCKPRMLNKYYFQ